MERLLTVQDLERLQLSLEDREKLARRRRLETADGRTFTLDPSVVGFVIGDTTSPAEKVAFRIVS
jgi:hypothetical protein